VFSFEQYPQLLSFFIFEFEDLLTLLLASLRFIDFFFEVHHCFFMHFVFLQIITSLFFHNLLFFCLQTLPYPLIFVSMLQANFLKHQALAN